MMLTTTRIVMQLPVKRGLQFHVIPELH